MWMLLYWINLPEKTKRLNKILKKKKKQFFLCLQKIGAGTLLELFSIVFAGNIYFFGTIVI